MRDFSTLGDRLGPKVARLVSEAVVATRRALGPHEVRVRRQATQDVIDQAGREIADHFRPIVRKILDLDDGSLDGDVRQFLEDSISGQHQLKAASGLITGAVSGTIGTFISNQLAPLLYSAIRTEPHLFVDTGTLANGVAQRTFTDADAANKASSQGIDNGQFARLVEQALSYPSTADALDLLRRGEITQAEFDLCLQRNAVPPGFIGPYASTRNIPLPADLAALAVLRSVIPQNEGERIAALSGVSAADFQIMIDDTGEPPGLDQLDEAYRRGVINKARLEKGIRQSRIRNEWIDVIEALRFSPISVADAVNAVVQNQLPQAQASAIAEQNGLEPGWIDTLIRTAGEPLSRTETEELYNRGLMTKAEVIQALRESRLKNKYNELAFDLHTRILEPRTLASAVEFGSISHADAVKHAMAYGYSEADATVLVGEGSARKLFSYKNRVITAAESLYEASGLSDAGFRDVMRSMGFSPEETGFVVQAADFRKKEKQVTTTVSAVRAKFIGRHLTEGQASAILDKSGLLAAQRDQLISTWKTERSAVVRNLTEAQLIRALKKKTLTVQQVDDRLIGMGYDQADAAILIADA